MLGEVGGARTTKTKQAGALPKIGKGAVCAQYRRCGKPNCHCARGNPHGPYFCLFWRERGRLRKRYLRLDEVTMVRATIVSRHEREQAESAKRREFVEVLRSARALLREVNRG